MVVVETGEARTPTDKHTNVDTDTNLYYSAADAQMQTKNMYRLRLTHIIIVITELMSFFSCHLQLTMHTEMYYGAKELVHLHLYPAY